MKGFLDRLEVDTTNRESTLMIYQKSHENTYLSARNIPYAAATPSPPAHRPLTAPYCPLPLLPP